MELFDSLPLEQTQKKEDNLKQTSTATAVKSQLKNAFDVLNMKAPKHRYIVEGLIPSKTLCMICGPSDTGKSILARQIAVSASLGRKQVGKFNLNLQFNKAIYVTTEDSDIDWQEKLIQYGLTPTEESELKNLKLIFDYEEDIIPQLEHELKIAPVDIIIVDVLSDIFSDDLNSATHVRRFLKPYKRLITEYDCSIVFIHHVSKKGEANIPSKLNVSGSQAIESKMRSVIELRIDPADDNIRQLVVTKANKLTPKEKKQTYKLELKPTLEFEFTGDRELISHLGKTKFAVSQEKVAELLGQGLSVRQTADKLTEEGTPVGKSRIGEISKKLKAEKQEQK